jgi:hypothetical protein
MFLIILFVLGAIRILLLPNGWISFVYGPPY